MGCPNITGWTGSGNRGWKGLLEDAQSCPWILAFSDGRNVTFQLASADVVWSGAQKRVEGLTTGWSVIVAWKDVYIKLKWHRKNLDFLDEKKMKENKNRPKAQFESRIIGSSNTSSKGRWKTSSLFIPIIYPILLSLSNKKWKFFRPCSSGFWASPLDKLGLTYVIFFKLFLMFLDLCKVIASTWWKASF